MRAIQYPEDLLFDFMLFRIGELVPRASKYLDPIVLKRICDAEIITPALNSPVRVRYATPGVVTTPANFVSTPARPRPSASCAAMAGPDSRVSMPIKTGFAPSPWRWKSSPSATPSAATVFDPEAVPPPLHEFRLCRITVFPCMCFALAASPHANLHCNLRRIENPHLRLRCVDCQLPPGVPVHVIRSNGSAASCFALSTWLSGPVIVNSGGSMSTCATIMPAGTLPEILDLHRHRALFASRTESGAAPVSCGSGECRAGVSIAPPSA